MSSSNVVPLRTAPVRLCIEETLPIIELVRALTAAGLCLSNTRDGLLIHRIADFQVKP